MLARILPERCAYCGGRTIAKTVETLAGYPACAACHAHFGVDVDRERLARVRAYRAERRGSHLDRLLPIAR